jgi:hypothetical protein
MGGALLDTRVTVELGPVLYSEMQSNGLLPLRTFGDPAFPNYPIEHTSYRDAFVLYGRELEPFEYRIGDGGFHGW